LVTELNRRFPVESDQDKFFTLVYGTIDLRTNDLCYVSAGHPTPVLVASGAAPKVLPGGGFPIGIVNEPGYEYERLPLGAGDRLVIYSDGLLDAENSAEIAFGKDRLLQCLAERHESLDQCVTALERHILRWCDGQRAIDDVSVLAIEVANPRGE
jgi:sigma-B regulation protein RsbU (phosphoserine phosphatase)